MILYMYAPLVLSFIIDSCTFCTTTGTLFREQSKGQHQTTEATLKATDSEKSLVDNDDRKELEQVVDGDVLTDHLCCDPALLNSDSYNVNCTCTNVNNENDT